MNLTFEHDDDLLFIFLYGELDEHSATNIRMRMDTLIESRKFRIMIVDFEKVAFVDSTGIGVLLGRYKKMNKLGRHIIVKNMNRQVDKLFSLCGLYDIIQKAI